MTISSFQKELFDELLWTAWNASWHASNSRPIWDQNKYELERNKKAFENHAKKFHEKGITLGLSEEVIENIKWGAWNAAWWTANEKSGNIFAARGDKEKFNQHFEIVINSSK